MQVFEGSSKEIFAVLKSKPGSARMTDHELEELSTLHAYNSLKPEMKRIFDAEIAPHSEYLAQLAKNAKKFKKICDQKKKEQESSASAPPTYSEASSSAAPQTNPGAGSAAEAAAARAAQQKEIASRAAAEAERVAAGRAKFLQDLRASIPSPAAVTAASLSSSPFNYPSPLAAVFRPPAAASNPSPTASLFQPPPVAPFQIQRPAQAAVQSSSGHAGTSQRSSCLPTCCPSVGPYVKMGVSVGAVVGIGIGGYMLSKQFTAV